MLREPIFTDADEAYIDAHHQRAGDPDAYDAYLEELQEQEAAARARQRLAAPTKSMRRYV